MNQVGYAALEAPPRDRPFHEPPSNEEFFCYPFEFLGPLGGNATDEFAIVIDGETSFKLYAAAVVATSRNFDVRFMDASSGRFFTDGRIPADAILGTGLRPFWFPCPKLVGAGSRLIVEARDRSGAGNTIRGALFGAKLYPYPILESKRYRDEQPFTYRADFIAGELGQVPANGTLPGGATIDNDADFLLEAIAISRTGTATLEMEDASAGRRFFERAVHVDNLAAAALGAALVAAERPFWLPVPRLIRARSSVLFNVADLSGAGNNIRIALHGRKWFL